MSSQHDQLSPQPSSPASIAGQVATAPSNPSAATTTKQPSKKQGLGKNSEMLAILNIDERGKVFQLWPTGDVYRTYEEYVEQLVAQKQPIWTCRFSGRSHLTFDDAFDSEQRAEAQIMSLPDHVKRILLQRIHGSSESIDGLAQALVDLTVTGPAVGDCVRVTVDGQAMTGRIAAIDDTVDPVQYRVELVGPTRSEDDSPVLAGEVGASGLGTLKVLEQKPMISKALAKKITRGFASRHPSTSQWMLDARICERYGFTPLMGAADGNSIQEQAFGSRMGGDLVFPQAPFAKVEEALPAYLTQDYPVPDLLVPVELRSTSTWPQPKPYEFDQRALESWNFLHVFAGPLELTPFSLEDWERALQKSEDQWVIWEETLIALIKPLIAHRREVSKTAFATLMRGLLEAVKGLQKDNIEMAGKLYMVEESTEEERFEENSSSSSSSGSRSSSGPEIELPRRGRGRPRKALRSSEVVRKSIRTLARLLPVVVVRPKKKTKRAFLDVRALKWYDLPVADHLLHQGYRKARIDSSTGYQLLVGMLVELESGIDWITGFLDGNPSILMAMVGIGELDGVRNLPGVFYSLSTPSLVALTHALVRANGQLPWLREWVNAQIEARDESRRHSRDLDSLRRTLKREISELGLQIGTLQARIEHPEEDQHALGKELKSLESKLRKLQAQECSATRQIEGCELSLCDRLWIEPLGIDRWARRYWCVAKRLFVEIDENRGQFFINEERPAEFAAIEDTDLDEKAPSVHEAVESPQHRPKASRHDTMTSVDIETQEPDEKAAQFAPRWHCYCAQSQLEDLLAYLSPYGRLESELLVALEELKNTLFAPQGTAGNADEEETADRTDTSEIFDMFSDERSDGEHESAGRRMRTRRAARGKPSTLSDKQAQLYVNTMR